MERACDETRDYAGSLQKMAGNEQIAAEVGKNRGGVGYVGLAYIKAESVKVVPIDGSATPRGIVASERLSFRARDFYYTNGAPSGEARTFTDFL